MTYAATERAPLTVSAAGVDTAAGDLAVELMKSAVKRTHGPEVLGGVGGFAGLFDASALRDYTRPLLATSTDGVGTKVAIAQAIDKHDTIGEDLVGMVVDDIVVVGARPLFMTDYIACGKVVPARIADIVAGIARGCALTGTALVGGETAEHPGLLGVDDLDGQVLDILGVGDDVILEFVQQRVVQGRAPSWNGFTVRWRSSGRGFPTAARRPHPRGGTERRAGGIIRKADSVIQGAGKSSGRSRQAPGPEKGATNRLDAGTGRRANDRGPAGNSRDPGSVLPANRDGGQSGPERLPLRFGLDTRPCGRGRAVSGGTPLVHRAQSRAADAVPREGPRGRGLWR